MGHAMFKANLRQHSPGRRLIDDAVVMLRQHDVFQRRQKGNQMELLKHQAYLLRANAPSPFFIQRRGIGSVEGFKYSTPMQAAHTEGKKWTYEHLYHFLKSPKAYVPGTIMAFAGIAKPDTRADVVAYLNTLADAPKPLPKP